MRGFDEQLSRSGFLRRTVSFVLLGLGASGAVRTRPTLAAATAPLRPLRRIAVRNAGRAFAGDRERFATISPRSGGGRRTATFAVSCDRDLDVVFEVTSRHGTGQTVHDRTALRLPRGTSEIPWTPAPSTPPGSYILRLREAGDPPGPLLGQAVVRVLDVEATFGRRSAVAGERAGLTVHSDAPWLRMTLLRCGPEGEPTYSNSLMKGVPVAPPQRVDLRGARDQPLRVPVDLPADLRAASTSRG